MKFVAQRGILLSAWPFPILCVATESAYLDGSVLSAMNEEAIGFKRNSNGKQS